MRTPSLPVFDRPIQHHVPMKTHIIITIAFGLLVLPSCEKAKHESNKVKEEIRHETAQDAEAARHAAERVKEQTRHAVEEAKK